MLREKKGMMSVVVLWSLAFTAFYTYVTFEGSWAKGFYYTVQVSRKICSFVRSSFTPSPISTHFLQAGLSIGFGVLGEDGPISLWASIFNVLLGALLGAYVLAAFTGDIVSKRSTLKKEMIMMRELGSLGDDQEKQERRLRAVRKKLDRIEDEQGVHADNVEWIGEILAANSRSASSRRSGALRARLEKDLHLAEGDLDFIVAGDQNSWHFDEVLAREVKQDADAAMKSIETQRRQLERLETKLRGRIARGWCRKLKLQVLLHADLYKTAAWFIFVVAVGVGFGQSIGHSQSLSQILSRAPSLLVSSFNHLPFLGLSAQDFTFTEAVYFAITSLSTAGLKGISEDSPQWQYLFVGVWCLIGVPAFGQMLGVVVATIDEAQQEAEMDDNKRKTDGSVFTEGTAEVSTSNMQRIHPCSSTNPPMHKAEQQTVLPAFFFYYSTLGEPERTTGARR